MESIVISLGGSVILSEGADRSFFENLVEIIKKASDRYKIFIVVGGGKTARIYIKQGRELNLDEKTLDQIGIEATRLNAYFLSNIFELSNKNIPKDTNEAKNLDSTIVIMGGTTPGHSTDMVGAELAEKVNASKFIIATNVDGVYDKDPNKYSDAQKYDKIHIDNLIKEYGTSWSSAGKNTVIDGPALKLIKEAKIPTFVLNGKKISELKKVFNNNSFEGTKIIIK